jgi:hypothetical protein
MVAVGSTGLRAGPGHPGREPERQRDPARQLHRGAAATASVVADVRAQHPTRRTASGPCWPWTRRADRCSGCADPASPRSRRPSSRPERSERPTAGTPSAGARSSGRRHRRRPAPVPTWSRPTWAPRTPRSAGSSAGYGSDPGTGRGLGQARSSAGWTGPVWPPRSSTSRAWAGCAGNTDYARRVVDVETTRDGADVAAFAVGDRRRGRHGDGAPRVLRADRPGPAGRLLPVVLNDLLRDDLRFTGVVISDDLPPRPWPTSTPPSARCGSSPPAAT